MSRSRVGSNGQHHVKGIISVRILNGGRAGGIVLAALAWWMLIQPLGLTSTLAVGASTSLPFPPASITWRQWTSSSASPPSNAPSDGSVALSRLVSDMGDNPVTLHVETSCVAIGLWMTEANGSLHVSRKTYSTFGGWSRFTASTTQACLPDYLTLAPPEALERRRLRMTDLGHSSTSHAHVHIILNFSTVRKRPKAPICST